MPVTSTELVGYLASALVVASLAMTSVVRLRTLSLVGSCTFVVYGLLIGSIPIVITNGSIAALNIWFLSRELGGQRDLGAAPVPVDSPFLVDFLTHHRADIARFQPSFSLTTEIDVAVIATRDGLPAGVVLGVRDGDVLMIELDYVLRAYRDSRIGHWLFTTGAGVFRDLGVRQLVARGDTESHQSYLRSVGFTYDDQIQRWSRRV